MQVSKKEESPTRIILTISAAQNELDALKKHTLSHFAERLKLPGFRTGKAPLSVVEKHVDQNQLQADFVEEAINHLYQKAVAKAELRPIDNPKVTLQKFVPFSELEFSAEVEILSPVTLPDYHKIRKAKPKIAVTEKEINEVIDSMRINGAERNEVQRAAKVGDEVIIDFTGKDMKKQPIKGADAKDYQLLLGSNSFIPGFEDNLIGMKSGDKKTFELTFPKDYAVNALAGKKVTFEVTLKKVQDVKKLEVNDQFAQKAGPFKTLKDLKVNIKTQLQTEKQNQAESSFQNELVKEIVDKSQLILPERLIEEQIERLKTEVRQNLMYRSQTWQEMLDAEGMKEEEFITKQLRPEAERRVKTGLVLAEISKKEDINVTPQEVDDQITLLKSQYQDSAMQAELDKSQAHQEIASRLITEKTVNMLVKNATTTKNDGNN